MIDISQIKIKDNVEIDAVLIGASKGNRRYVVINKKTGEILANGNGYGYKTKEGAIKAFNYKICHYSGNIVNNEIDEIKRWEKYAPYWILTELKSYAFELLCQDGDFRNFDKNYIFTILENADYPRMAFDPILMFSYWFQYGF